MDVIAYFKELDEEEKFYKDKLNEVESDPYSREYTMFSAGIKRISRTKESLQLEYKKQVYTECKHIVCVVDESSDERDTFQFYRCVKCGLDDRVVYDLTLYPLEECRNMWECLPRTFQGQKTLYSPVCIEHNYEEVHSLYSSMKTVNPELTDEEFLTECVNKFGINPSIIETYKSTYKPHIIRKKDQDKN